MESPRTDLRSSFTVWYLPLFFTQVIVKAKHKLSLQHDKEREEAQIQALAITKTSVAGKSVSLFMGRVAKPSTEEFDRVIVSLAESTV